MNAVSALHSRKERTMRSHQQSGSESEPRGHRGANRSRVPGKSIALDDARHGSLLARAIAMLVHWLD
jgi:hypothetical protein